MSLKNNQKREECPSIIPTISISMIIPTISNCDRQGWLNVIDELIFKLINVIDELISGWLNGIDELIFKSESLVKI